MTGLTRCEISGNSYIGDLKLVVIFGCWWQNFHLGDIFPILLSDANVTRYWMLVTKRAKTVTIIFNLSPTHFVSYIDVTEIIYSVFRASLQKVGFSTNDYWSNRVVTSKLVFDLRVVEFVSLALTILNCRSPDERFESDLTVLICYPTLEPSIPPGWYVPNFELKHFVHI